MPLAAAFGSVPDGWNVPSKGSKTISPAADRPDMPMPPDRRTRPSFCRRA
ncbi:hypothetical protein [Lysobacter gummosus]